MKRETSTGDADSEAHVPSQLPAEDTSPASTAEQQEVNSNGFKFHACYSGWYTMLQPHILQLYFNTPFSCFITVIIVTYSTVPGIYGNRQTKSEDEVCLQT